MDPEHKDEHCRIIINSLLSHWRNTIFLQQNHGLTQRILDTDFWSIRFRIQHPWTTDAPQVFNKAWAKFWSCRLTIAANSILICLFVNHEAARSKCLLEGAFFVISTSGLKKLFQLDAGTIWTRILMQGYRLGYFSSKSNLTLWAS